MHLTKNILLTLALATSITLAVQSLPFFTFSCNEAIAEEVNSSAMGEHSDILAFNESYKLAEAASEIPTGGVDESLREPVEPEPTPTTIKDSSTDKSSAAEEPEINTISQDIQMGSSKKNPKKDDSSIISTDETTTQEEEKSDSEDQQAAKKSGGGSKDKSKEKKVKFSGYRYIKHRFYSASGNASSYISKAGLSNRSARFEQGTALKVTAEFGKKSSLEGSFSELPLQDRKMLVKLTQGKLGMTYGNFSVKFSGGDLSPFSKNINGFQVDLKDEKHSASFFTSQSKSQTKTIKITGRNIKGPYDLNARDLLADSISVRLNDQALSPDDYFFEPYLGQITFYEILGPDDEVVIAFDQNLTGNLNEGSLTGLSYDYVMKKGDLKMGVSVLQKGAFSGSQSTLSVQNEDVFIDKALSTIQLKSSASKAYFLVVRKDIFRGSETITRNNKKLIAGTDYNVGTDDSSTATKAKYYEAYAHGKFIMKEPITDVDIFRVSYSYYREDVTTCYTKENAVELSFSSTTSTEAYLGSDAKTMYYGSEKIYECSTPDISTCDETNILIRGTDYKIDETKNVITFTNYSPLAGKTYRFEGCTYPDVSVVSSAYDHKLVDYRVKYAPSKAKYELSYETAQSEADVSSKPISVLNETIMNAQATDLDCTGAGAKADACTLTLSHGNVVSGSLILYFNDRISDDSVINPYENFDIDTLNGKVKLNMLVPAGTPVIVDFQYNPPLRAGPETGSKSKLKGAYKSKLTNASFELNSGDTYFTPIGGATNLETSRTSFQVSRIVNDRLDVGFTLLNVTSALDIDENNELQGKQSSYSINYKPKFLKSLQYKTSFNDRSDNYNPRRTDTSERRSTFSTGLVVPLLDNADMTFSISNGEVTDNTSVNNRRTTDNTTIGFNYSPSKRLSFSTKFTTNEIAVQTKDNSFVSTNRSRSLTGKWQPFALISLVANFDTQLKSDSRNANSDSEVNKSRFSITSAPFGKVKTASYSFSQEDRPSISGVSSGSNNSTLTFGYRISGSFSTTPTLSVTRTDAGSNSKTRTVSKSNSLEYLPPGKPYRANLDYQNTQSTSVRESGGDNQTNETWSSTVSYIPSSTWNYSLKFEKDAQTSKNDSGFDTFTLNTKINRVPSKTQKQWFLFQRISRSGSVSQTDSIYELGNDMQLNKIISFNIFIRYSSFSNDYNSASNYSGYIVESMFKATF